MDQIITDVQAAQPDPTLSSRGPFTAQAGLAEKKDGRRAEYPAD